MRRPSPAARRAGRGARRRGERSRPGRSARRARSRRATSTVSPQPPRSSRPTGSRVTTVTAPPRSKASTWSAAGPVAGTAAYDVNSSGRSRRSRSAVAVTRSLGWPAVGEQRDPVVEVDRPAVVGVGQAVVPQLGALVDVRHAGDRQREQLGGEAVAAAGRVERGDQTVDDRSVPRRSRRPRRRRRASRPRTPRRGRSTWCGRRPRASPSRRTRAGARAIAGQAPTTACHSSDPKPGSGSGTSASSRSSAVCPHVGSSASTAIRARVSSLRLVSWVVVAVIASGQSRCRSAIAAWKSRRIDARSAPGRRRPR